MEQAELMQGTDYVVLLLAAGLVLSIIIERLVEVFVAITQFHERHTNSYVFWNKRGEKLQNRLQNTYESADISSTVLAHVLKTFASDASDENGVAIISVEKLRKNTYRHFARFLSVLLGVGIALWLNIDIVNLVKALQNDGKFPLEESYWAYQVFTGVAMGFGAEPVHKLIMALEKGHQFRQNIKRGG